jgi:flagellar biosynthesis protein FlhF
MGADFAVATNAAEAARVLDHARADLVLVDTAGHADPAEDGVERWLGSATMPGRERHVLLGVPAALRAEDARRVATAFAVSRPSALCITKLDDTRTPAGIVHASTASRLPIAVVCNGPRVPEDVAPATSAVLLEALVPQGGRRMR